MLRNSLLRRHLIRSSRRYLHEDSRTDILGFSVSKPLSSDPRFGMDMTHAPGYQVLAEEDPPLEPHHRLADFAIRHARLTSAQVENAGGYLWVGSVLYPNEVSADDYVTFTWEVTQDRNDFDSELSTAEEGDDRNERLEKDVHGDKAVDTVIEAKRRYTGGQARRIRKERDASIARKINNKPKNRRPIRKPHNDIPPEEDV